jgi:hypothetical protein
MGDCIRKLYYEWTLTPKEYSGDAPGDRFDLGKQLEWLLIQWIARAGLWRGEQVHTSSQEFNTSGSMDNLMEWLGAVYPVEIKGVNWERFGYVSRTPAEENVAQLMSYLWTEEYSSGFLAYITVSPKGEIVWKFTLVERDENAIKLLRMKQVALESHVAMRTPPERPTTNPASYWKCGVDKKTKRPFCPFRALCWSGTEFALMPSSIVMPQVGGLL